MLIMSSFSDDSKPCGTSQTADAAFAEMILIDGKYYKPPHYIILDEREKKKQKAVTP